jgi:hypothetical protein
MYKRTGHHLHSLPQPAAPARREGRGAGSSKETLNGRWREKEKGENESNYFQFGVIKIVLIHLRKMQF